MFGLELPAILTVRRTSKVLRFQKVPTHRQLILPLFSVAMHQFVAFYIHP